MCAPCTHAPRDSSGCERGRCTESGDRATVRCANEAHISPTDRCWSHRAHPCSGFRNAVIPCGMYFLALAVRPAASLLAVLTLVCYLFLYTPLKRRTPMCTLVGAFPGAMP